MEDRQPADQQLPSSPFAYNNTNGASRNDLREINAPEARREESALGEADRGTQVPPSTTDTTKPFSRGTYHTELNRSEQLNNGQTGDTRSNGNSLSSRKRTRQGRYLSDISLDEVLQFIHLPSKEASEKLGLGLTSFKRLCRELGIQTWPYKAGKPLDPSFVDQMLASRHTERDLDRRMHLGNQTMSKNTNTMDGNNAACDGGTSVLTLPHQRPISASKVADLQAIRRLELPSTIDEKIEMLRQINEVLELSRGMRSSCGFSIFDDSILSALVSKVLE